MPSALSTLNRAKIQRQHEDGSNKVGHAASTGERRVQSFLISNALLIDKYRNRCLRGDAVAHAYLDYDPRTTSGTKQLSRKKN